MAVNILCQHKGVGARTVEGSPLFSYYVSIFHQVLLFPGCLFMVIREWRQRRQRGKKDASLSAWIRSGWAGASRWRAVFHYIAFGYFAKDLFIPMSMELIAHHVLCVVLTTLSLADLPAMPMCTSACFVLVTTALEMGSCGHNLAVLHPKSDAWSWASLGNMAVSNSIGAAIALWYSLAVNEGSSVSRGVITGIGLMLMSLRQVFEWQRHAQRHTLQ